MLAFSFQETAIIIFWALIRNKQHLRQLKKDRIDQDFHSICSTEVFILSYPVDPVQTSFVWLALRGREGARSVKQWDKGSQLRDPQVNAGARHFRKHEASQDTV